MATGPVTGLQGRPGASQWEGLERERVDDEEAPVTDIRFAALSTRCRVTVRRVTLCLAALCLAGAPAAADIESYAIVQDDASLQIRGKTIRLFGVHVPTDATQCRTNIRPARCASRAALALDFKIQGFVHCREVRENPDGSIDAFCSVNHSRFSDGEDLGAYLIGHGLALALPDAPFAYHAQEKIARANGRGVWGFQVDSTRRR
jgi:endonuclease YncB( thermonuclease family)